MLLAILKLGPSRRMANWRLAYVSARDMGQWLSGEVHDGSIRSWIRRRYQTVLRRTRLVVLLGFEVGRARSIIESYEPKQIVLGMGGKSESISDDLYYRNKELFDQLAREFAGSLEDLHSSFPHKTHLKYPKNWIASLITIKLQTLRLRRYIPNYLLLVLDVTL